jgi:general secretion pathway protein A
MYTHFFGLQKLPFSLTPDPAFLFLPPKHREALAGLTYAVLKRKGFVVLTGDAGTGKTTLINTVFNHLPSDRIESSIILNPTLTAGEFLEGVMLDFDIPDVPASKAQRLWRFQEFLTRTYQENKLAVLVVDEAHKLSPEVLEEIRLLGNFESATDKFLQILLLGQSELDDILNRYDLRQFKQRVALRLSIDRLTDSEVAEYVRFRWTTAGGTGALPFTPEALEGIARCSQGIPRLINSICDTTLLMAFGDESRSVDITYVRSAAASLVLEDASGEPLPNVVYPHPGATVPHTVAAAHSTVERKSAILKLAPLEFPAPSVVPAVNENSAPKLAPNGLSKANSSSLLKRMADKLGFNY